MKSLLSGLVAAIIIGAIGLILLRATGVIKLPVGSASPSPISSATPNFELLPSASPYASMSPTPTPSASSANSTKGGIVLGETVVTPRPSARPVTTTTTTTTEKKVTSIRVFETSSCPVDGWSEIKDIQSPLSLKFWVKDNYSATVTMWKLSGETFMQKTLIKNSGVLATLPTGEGIKIHVVSENCNATSDTWLKLTATR